MVIGEVNLVYVASQCREGRVYTLLQVYFITQLQHILNSNVQYELGQFHFARFL